MRPLMKVFVSIALLASIGCSKQQEPPPFTVELRASTEDGTPLPGAAFTLGSKAAGTTTADGRVVRQVTGEEGTTLRVGVACPPDFDPPPQLPVVRLTRTRSIDARQAQPLPVEVRCERRLNDVVVVVKAERGARLPVLIDGKPVTSTDDDGVAHVLLRRSRAEKRLDVALDTSGRASLKPINPARTYETNGRDAVVLFEQTFVTAPSAVARAAPSRRHVPVRVD